MPKANLGRVQFRRYSMAASLIVALVFTSLATAPGGSVRAQGQVSPQIFHLPMRWCVLEGTRAARSGANAAVLERIRRGSSILAPQAGITLRSAFNATLAGALGFPVISDPLPDLGRLGDVRVPTESSAEYQRVVDRCARAWRRLEQRSGPGSDLGGVARGPIAVIIRDFVDGRGRRFESVWGYAFSASTSGAYCTAADPSVRRASGGSLMVVDTSDGVPSATLDRRLIAHEIGHILRLGHGNGLDDPGSIRGRIDKFCDDTENADAVPGSLMSANLRYERVLPWQRRLPRLVAARHPSTVEDRPIIRVRPPRVRRRVLQRLANGGSRTITRLLPPGHRPMSPLDRLRSAGVRGAEVDDAFRDFDLGGLGGSADLTRFGISEDGLSGDLEVWFDARGAPGGGGTESEFQAGLDGDGDSETGGDPSRIPGNPVAGLAGLAGLELVSSIAVRDRRSVGRAWRWDAVTDAWDELDPPPTVRLTGIAGEADDEPRIRTGVMEIPAGVVDLGGRFGIAGVLSTTAPDGRTVDDSQPSDLSSGETIPLSLEPADYPVCAVNRDAMHPGVADPGGRATLEAYGFGADGPVSIWLGDRPEPIGSGDYSEIPDDPWPWVTEIAIPDDAQTALQIVQVVFGDSGLTAECVIAIGDAELPDWDA